jgi:hypothetical protein
LLVIYNGDDFKGKKIVPLMAPFADGYWIVCFYNGEATPTANIVPSPYQSYAFRRSAASVQEALADVFGMFWLEGPGCDEVHRVFLHLSPSIWQAKK